jgi:putative phosphoesterase
MRAGNVAALYDVHGNAPALASVLAEVDAAGVDAIVVGGDAVSGPMPAETIELLERQKRPVAWVRGNADRVLDFAGTSPDDPVWRAARLWVAERLGEERLAFLARLPLDAVVEIETLGPVRFCHGAPGSDELTITRLKPDERLAELLEGVEEPLVVCGHTHVQFDRSVGSTRVVNAGSVGYPYEARRGAYWALLGPDVELRRTEYDVEAAAARFRTLGYPRIDDYAGTILAEDEGRPAAMSALIEGLG